MKAAGALRRYAVYGCTLATDHLLVTSLEPSAAAPDVIFTCGPGAVPGLAPEALVYRSGLQSDGGEPAFQLFRTPAGFRLHYPGAADFDIGRDRIHCRLNDPAYAYWVEIALLGPVLSFWLELTGAIALHASAVITEGVALGFMARSGSGKTSLAAAFMAQGDPLLTDDILPLRLGGGSGVEARPGHPQLRLWPAEVARYAGRPEDFPLVHPDFEKRRVPARALGSFHAAPAPLGALFLPERWDDVTEVEVVPLPGPEAVTTLLRSSFAVAVLEAMPDMQRRRLGVVADIVGRVPVCCLRYPAGYERLLEVRAAVVRWLRER